MLLRCVLAALVAVTVSLEETRAQPRREWKPLGPFPAAAALGEYFQSEVAQLQGQCLSEIHSLADWQARCEEYRRQLREMLGLDPWPAKSDLKATVTGVLEREDYRVEKLHFQSLPGLYVTANLYLPKNTVAPVPAILYLCGHAQVKMDNISYGNKAHYHFHAVWFARHGYACLVLDSLQLGEIEGIHHGTYRYGMWWWNNRGYTPAGVEAWNCVRALDYLETRPEIDASRFGVTGRSGGGAYSWWIAAIDPRVKVAVPVAGITDLQNHVIDGCVEGHCDCMYMVNTYRWDYPLVAALVAPRPLLIANGDHDPIFPEDGVRRVYEGARKIYQLFGAEDKIGLFITKAAHDDIPPIQEAAFRWFDRHLLGQEREIYDPVEKTLTPQELKVFAELPQDQINTTIQEHFIPPAAAEWPKSPADWDRLRTVWPQLLREKCFRGWPTELPPAALRVVNTVEHDAMRISRLELAVQPNLPLTVYRLESAEREPTETILEVLDATEWRQWLKGLKVAFAKALQSDLVTAEDQAVEADLSTWETMKSTLAAAPGRVVVLLPPRGVGPNAWTSDARKTVQIERRFMLIGQTSDGMRVYDILRAVQAVREWQGLLGKPVCLKASRGMGVLACLAAVFAPVDRAVIIEPPLSLREGPYLLNVDRVLGVPQMVLLAAASNPVQLHVSEVGPWLELQEVVARLGGTHTQLQILPRQ